MTWPARTSHRRYPFLILAAIVPLLAIICAGLGTESAEAQTATSVPKSADPATPQAKDARIGGDVARTRFVADLSKVVPFSVRVLPDPYRVIVDLADVNFQMPPGVGSKARGLVNAFRFGNFAEGKSRIVIDVVEPVAVEKAFVREAESGQPARLVIDMVRTTKEEFMKAYEAQLEAERAKRASLGGRGWQTSIVQDPNIVHDPKTVGDPKTAGKPVIVIDPGHGGIDPGTQGSLGVLEKSVVFAFCLELKRQLEAVGRFRVLLTRETDIFIPLGERVSFARSQGGDLFISIHADAIDKNHPLLGAAGPRIAQEVRGASIYTLSEKASDAEAQASAARENLSDIIAGLDDRKTSGDEVSNILIDLVQRATKNESREFSNILVSHLRGITVMNSKAQRFANFTVLRAPDVPSVLIELGYLSNREDEKQLISPEWREKVAGAMVSAITSFFSQAQSRIPF